MRRLVRRTARRVWWGDPVWIITVLALLALAGLAWIGLGAPWPGQGVRW